VDFAVLCFTFGGEAKARLFLDGAEQAGSCVASDFGTMLESVA
jgi:hypothetical protein